MTHTLRSGSADNRGKSSAYPESVRKLPRTCGWPRRTRELVYLQAAIASGVPLQHRGRDCCHLPVGVRSVSACCFTALAGLRPSLRDFSGCFSYREPACRDCPLCAHCVCAISQKTRHTGAKKDRVRRHKPEEGREKSKRTGIIVKALRQPKRKRPTKSPKRTGTILDVRPREPWDTGV